MKEMKGKSTVMKDAKNKKQKKSRIFISDHKGRFMRKIGKIVSFLLMIVSAFAILAMVIEGQHHGAKFIIMCFFHGTVIFVGLALYLIIYNTEKRLVRFRYYRSFLEEREYILLSEMARITGRKIVFLQEDISRMIRQGWFLQAKLNRQSNCLFLTKEAYQRYQSGQLILNENADTVNHRLDNEKKTTESFRTQDTMEEEKEQDRGDTFEEKCGEQLSLLDYWIGQIRNKDIVKPASDLCIRGQQILYFKDTKLADDVERFLLYYLPTANTVLETYVELEKEEMEQQTEDLKVIINTMKHSFDTFAEKLIEGKRVDVEESIAAMEQMLLKQKV